MITTNTSILFADISSPYGLDIDVCMIANRL